MSLPPLAPVPPAAVRIDLGPQEWEACLDAWITLAELHLRSPLRQFSQEDSLSDFLTSFYRELTSADPSGITLAGPKIHVLQRSTFLILERLVAETDRSTFPLDLTFLSMFCRVHMKAVALGRLMHSLWKQKAATLEKSLQEQKEWLTSNLDSASSKIASEKLGQLVPILRASPDAASFFMAGSDFADALAAAYNRSQNAQETQSIVSTAYLCLISLLQVENSNLSSLSDHLYSLKSQADSQSHQPSILADLSTNTPLIGKLRRMVSGKSTDRFTKLLAILETYRMPSIARSRNRPRSTVKKTKGKSRASHSDLQVHHMSLVTQIQDLFPDLGSGFVLKLLHEYDDDVEQVTAHLLDETLPPHLQSLDRNEGGPPLAQSEQEQVDQLVPRSTPPPPEPFVPDRRNVFDEDDLDRLEFDTSRLNFGKKEADLTTVQPNKAAILSALAAFDSDDDERDDTYDIEDVGGTVDSAHPDGEPGQFLQATQGNMDATLFAVYKSSPELLGRTFDVRKGQARAALKTETGMTDEAIEGWAIMLRKDPKRLNRLESKVGAFDGKQTELHSTAYRESPSGTDADDSDAPRDFRNAPRGGFRGRGRGRAGRGGGGGSVAGPSNEASTIHAQRRKEANKGSRANHNRRDQRAKKMARGGFPG